jgi:hypothetical protein
MAPADLLSSLFPLFRQDFLKFYYAYAQFYSAGADANGRMPLWPTLVLLASTTLRTESIRLRERHAAEFSLLLVNEFKV